MNAYRHTVQYYETDRMGIVHHSNYIRWMEEARIHMMEQMGMGYDMMEAEGTAGGHGLGVPGNLFGRQV